MDKRKALFGIKWNPFSPEVPVEALWRTPQIESFCWRVRQLLHDGGFAMLAGPVGSGKSAMLRLLAEECSGLRDVQVGVVSRPQASIADFYRELGDLFGVQLRPHNRWAGAKVLRERWQAYIDASDFRPLLLIDEAQETKQLLLEELRLLSSSKLDSHLLLTVVLAGDKRLQDRLRSEDLAPLGSRIRVRLMLDRTTPADLRECLTHAMRCAGNAKLMTPELVNTLCEHAQGNLRALMNLAAELLDLATQRELSQLDEKLFFEAFPTPIAQAKGGRRK
jgi:general secretion pathway protein A